MKYTHVILGGTGHIGAALSTSLLQSQQKVMIIGHDPAKAAEWTVKGAAYEVADIRDTARLKELFGQAERLFVLNPNAAPDKDIDAVEREQIGSILNALEGTRTEKDRRRFYLWRTARRSYF
ncbi:NAD-dependent epimerase/dehydratase family protein [Mucilaginibacter sp. P25]|uniref:NAD-dependent epimerase/dehydratase family protein n=1 Tax=unclassified Mucilaginibacter TaxID=2617802 RepID=UPI003D6786EA